MPPDSSTWRTLSPQTAQWGNTEELLAIIAERTGGLMRLFIQGFSAKRVPPSDLPDPTIVRPYDVGASSSTTSSSSGRPRRRRSTKEELKRFMGNRVRYTPREG